MSINNSNLASKNLTIKIITPDATIFEGRAEMITAPSMEGELGFLPAHLPIIFQISEGLVKLYAQGLVEHSVFIFRGYGQLYDDVVTITCEYASNLAKTSKKQNEEIIAELNEKVEQLKNAGILQDSSECSILQDKLNRHNSLIKFFK